MYTSSQASCMAVSVVLGFLAVLSVILRFLARLIKKAPVLADDWLILISLITALANCIMVAWGAGVYALGTSVADMTTDTWVAYEKILFIQPTIMMFDLCTIKLSVIFFYKRIFTTKRFFLIANILIAIITMWGIGSFFAQVFEQWPVSDNWTAAQTGGHKNYILNYSDFNMAYSCLDLALDVIVLSMPMFMIRRLQLSAKKKIILAGIFLLGSLSVIAEAVRVWILWRIAYGPQVSVVEDSVLSADVVIWGIVEACVSIVAASLPMLGPTFFEKRGPESIVRSIRSTISLRSSAPSVSNSQRSKRAPTSSREIHQQWIDLESQGHIAVIKKSASVDHKYLA